MSVAGCRALGNDPAARNLVPNLAGNFHVEIEDGYSNRPKGTKILVVRDTTSRLNCLC